MDYLLKNVPDELWRKVKAKCAINGETIKDLIVELLQGYVDEKLILRRSKPERVRRNRTGR